MPSQKPKSIRSQKAPRGRWPGLPGQPRPRIPAKAQEKVTRLNAAGSKESSEFWLAGRLVGRASWYDDGTPLMAVGLHDGRPIGYQLEYHDNGTVSYAEPFVDGRQHGWAKQYDLRGRLLMLSPFKQGTGVDYWCDYQGRLSEEHPLVGGRISGCDRWWNEDQETIYLETDYLDGAYHGLTRQWTKGKLDRGFPKFFIRGEQVSKRAYLTAARADPTLPPYRPEEDAPARTLPERFLELRRRMRRMLRAKGRGKK